MQPGVRDGPDSGIWARGPEPTPAKGYRLKAGVAKKASSQSEGAQKYWVYQGVDRQLKQTISATQNDEKAREIPMQKCIHTYSKNREKRSKILKKWQNPAKMANTSKNLLGFYYQQRTMISSLKVSHNTPYLTKDYTLDQGCPMRRSRSTSRSQSLWW